MSLLSLCILFQMSGYKLAFCPKKHITVSQCENRMAEMQTDPEFRDVFTGQGRVENPVCIQKQDLPLDTNLVDEEAEAI